jgi:hypothetical protein
MVWTVSIQIIGVFLFAVNFLHGQSKVEKLRLPLWLRVFLAVTYVPLAFLILDIAVRR